MKKIALRNLVLLLCLVTVISFTGCASEAKKAMDESVDTANELLEKDAKPFDAETETALEKAVKTSEEAEDDDAYKKVKKDIDNAIKAYQDSVKQQKQVTEPKEKFLVERVKTVKSVTAVEAATEKTDANTLMNKKGGYYAYVAMKSSLIDDSYDEGESPVEAGTEGGAVIEAFHTVKDAKARDAYLSGFDGAGMLSPGSHRVIGTLVIRTSDELSASDQKKLENRIVDALVKLE